MKFANVRVKAIMFGNFVGCFDAFDGALVTHSDDGISSTPPNLAPIK
jgi:hypothetical protein